MPDRPARTTPATVIAHRGASALRPEHTLAAYAQAIADGADFIEPDLVSTRDGVLVARHDNELGLTTDVAAHPEFAARRAARVVDGHPLEGWFVEDFTLAELRTLRARERLPQVRSTAFDGQFGLATFDEIVALVAAEAGAQGRLVGLIPEIKHPSYFRARGLPVEERLLAALRAHAYTRTAPVVIQSFELGNLRWLRERLGDLPNVRLLQLLGAPAAAPADTGVDGEPVRTYAELATPAGLRGIAQVADGIGVSTRAVVPRTADGGLGAPTPLVDDAHAAGLEVIAYTYRPENHFLPRALWDGDDPRTVHAAGSIAEIRAGLAAGIDGFFTDHPAIGRAALARE
jgi:glycerophosphoryl diester phosphodiesterase